MKKLAKIFENPARLVKLVENIELIDSTINFPETEAAFDLNCLKNIHKEIRRTSVIVGEYPIMG